MKKLLSFKKFYFVGLSFLFISLLPLPSSYLLSKPYVVRASNIEDEQSNIKINNKSKALVKDTSYALKIYNLSDGQKVVFKSKDSSVASVDKDGVITGNSLGSTIVTITVKGGSKKTISFECNVTVGPPAISITLTRRDLVITQGKKRSLKAILKPNNTVDEVFYSSSDNSIATVDSNGRITAISPGEVIITAYVNSSLKDLCIITVTTEIIDLED